MTVRPSPVSLPSLAQPAMYTDSMEEWWHARRNTVEEHASSPYLNTTPHSGPSYTQSFKGTWQPPDYQLNYGSSYCWYYSCYSLMCRNEEYWIGLNGVEDGSGGHEYQWLTGSVSSPSDAGSNWDQSGWDIRYPYTLCRTDGLVELIIGDYLPASLPSSPSLLIQCPCYYPSISTLSLHRSYDASTESYGYIECDSTPSCEIKAQGSSSGSSPVEIGYVCQYDAGTNQLQYFSNGRHSCCMDLVCLTLTFIDFSSRQLGWLVSTDCLWCILSRGHDVQEVKDMW